MAFLAPILGSLGGAGLSAVTSGKANQQAQNNNLQQQQAAIAAWKQAIQNFQGWMGDNPSPYAGGVNVSRPGAISARPYQPRPMPAGGVFAGGGRGAPGQGARPPIGAPAHPPLTGPPMSAGVPMQHMPGPVALPPTMTGGSPPPPPSNGVPPGLAQIIAHLQQGGGGPRPMMGPMQ